MARVQIAAAVTLSGNSLRQTVHAHCASVHRAAKLVAALLRVAGVTAGLVESNGSLPPGLWLTSPAGWLPRTGISSGTLCSVIEYGLPLPFLDPRHMFCDIWRTSLHQFLPGHSIVISRTHVVCYCSGTLKTFFQTMNMSTKQLNLLNIDKTANNAKTSKNALYTCRIRTAHTHPFNGPCPGLPGWAGTRKIKPIWILLKLETVSGSGISWTICKSAPRSRQITMPAPQRSVFYRLDALPAAQPTVSKHWRHCGLRTDETIIS